LKGKKRRTKEEKICEKKPLSEKKNICEGKAFKERLGR